MPQVTRLFAWWLALSLAGALVWMGMGALRGQDALRPAEDDEIIEVGGQA